MNLELIWNYRIWDLDSFSTILAVTHDLSGQKLSPFMLKLEYFRCHISGTSAFSIVSWILCFLSSNPRPKNLHISPARLPKHFFVHSSATNQNVADCKLLIDPEQHTQHDNSLLRTITHSPPLQKKSYHSF